MIDELLVLLLVIDLPGTGYNNDAVDPTDTDTLARVINMVWVFLFVVAAILRITHYLLYLLYLLLIYYNKVSLINLFY